MSVAEAEVVWAGELLSATCTVKFDVPLAVGVPEMAPALDSARPAGKLPDAIDHVYEGVPPLTLNAALYALPTCPADSDVEPMLRPDPLT